ncbi:hypothetical protein ACJJTC_005458 [Scirpophaga incertulas]
MYISARPQWSSCYQGRWKKLVYVPPPPSFARVHPYLVVKLAELSGYPPKFLLVETIVVAGLYSFTSNKSPYSFDITKWRKILHLNGPSSFRVSGTKVRECVIWMSTCGSPFPARTDTNLWTLSSVYVTYSCKQLCKSV